VCDKGQLQTDRKSTCAYLTFMKDTSIDSFTVAW
jgi:hypothetical protein